MIKIEVNKKILNANRGETILSAIRKAGIQVPTLCSMADLSPTGACRLCVVEVEGYENLVPACSFPVQEWMKIKTHSPRVLQARKANVELLLSNHPDDCLYCERNGNCELQKLSEDLNVRNRNLHSQKSKFKIDNSSKGIIRDPAKCVLCGRCVRICDDIVGISAIDFERRGDQLRIATALAEPLAFSSCIDCGQCLVSCPTAALADHTQFQDLDESLDDPDKIVIVQYSPEVAVSLAEEFGLRPGTELKSLINNALKKIGFELVFETAFGAEVHTLELVSEFSRRYKKGETLPLITSRCPAWVNYVESFRPDLLSNLLPVRSPAQILGRLVKTWYARKEELPVNRIHSVLITNCTASKQEAGRPEYSTDNVPDIDFVITTRELARLIRLNGIDLLSLEQEPSDGPFQSVTSAGDLFALAGGELEAGLRSMYREFNKREMPDVRINKLRNNKALKEASIRLKDKEVNVAAVNGLKNALELLDEMDAGKVNYELLEVLVCPDGCVNGGGQPIPPSSLAVKARNKTVYDLDKANELKVAHKSKLVQNMYSELARNPGSKESKELFFTKFSSKPVLK